MPNENSLARGTSSRGASDDLARRGGRLTYMPGLDGLRALAVLAVVLYHAGLPLRGGFLGVDIFFVLSGFLITLLLHTEWRARGRVDLRSFWLRRARRLLPALFGLLAGVLLLQALLVRTGMPALGDDVAAALVYVMNWRLIWNEQSYFDPLIRPSLLQHLWSLAVEEQFYLLWPVLFVLGMRVLRSSGLLLAALVAVIASAASMAALYVPGVDPSRVYYGTDTRASGLLLGAALALRWRTDAPVMPIGGGSHFVRELLGVLALAGLGAAVIWLPETHPLLYRGGFLLVELSTVVVIAAVAAPHAQLLPRLLGRAPLIWIGQRSYGIYLWHWPIFLVTRSGLDVPLGGWPLLILRLGLTVGIAALSYRFVEQPVRLGALARAWRSHRTQHAVRSLAHALAVPGRRWLSLAVVVALVANIGTCAPEHGAPIAAAPVAVAAPARPLIAPAQATAGPRATSASPRAAQPASSLASASPSAAPSATAGAAATAPLPGDAEPDGVPASPETAVEPAPAAPALPAIDGVLAAELQRLLDAAVAGSDAPGAVLAVGIPGKQTWIGASGVADVATEAPMEPATQVRLASTSKLFTAVVVVQLVQEGQIDLDAPIATYLPDLLPDGDAITVRQLLNHTSGLYDYLEDRDLIAEAYRDPAYDWAPTELVDYAVQFPRRFRPGAEGVWDYSSTNYVVLGMLVEQRSGNTLAAEIRHRIVEPLALTQTVFTPTEPVPGTLAHGYSDTVDLADVPMSFAFGTGSIVSTAGDLERFAEALFGGALLEPATLAEMQRFVDGRGQYGMPDLAYGLGLMRNRLPVGPAADGHTRLATASTVLGHIGGFGGFRSAVWYAPDSGITIALALNQASADPNDLATGALDAVLTAQGQ